MLLACGTFQSLSAQCLEVLEKMNKEVGTFNIYNIYDTCGRDQRRRRLREVDETSTSDRDHLSFSKIREVMSSKVLNISTTDSFKVSAGYGEALNG
jgi:hypothetical protein